ncbi:L,D-transpeptidase family protein [Paracoccus laeviglucosivorans]|uniref:Lipoprotein-anchoring transpeptidase ErfK/SrfK n=1 Tax=Paracoccus laeviglucosivorans TaxID=1197861 RepID=A0A521DCN9_9RHOB|nr:L,D-transpeptidase [Paracoccus laeviglucosivorans]SMO69358.1 Lipoprotein-anchoring transpeptidase ErfK/SrfK [Paracoccus laeviglucosivorans]
MFQRPLSGAIPRLLLVSAAAILPAGMALAQSGPHPRPPARAAAVTATLPVQTAAEPALAATAVGTTPSTSPSIRALASISPTEIETATYNGGDLPPGQSALTAKVQILLDRSGISPGVVDGWRGGMSESAIKAFQRRAGLPMTGRMDFVVWDLLHGYAAEAVTMSYTITDEDAQGLVDNIPSDYAEKAAMTSQGYTSILEKLGERFHMDEKFLAKLNPGLEFKPGATIVVTKPAKPIRATVTRIIVDKQTRRVAAYDARGNMVADYPATVGSSDTPSPHGTHVVNAVALNPTYTYNPQRNFKQGENDRVLIVPPGPNGPVGNVWIDLSEPTYGIHGTATPSRLFVNQSHGCVRLTNWDAHELAHMVKAKVTTVEFLDPGVSIADVTGGAAPVASAVLAQDAVTSARPPARSAGVLARAAMTTLPADAGAATTPAAIAVTPDAPVVATSGAAASVAGTDPLPAPAAAPEGESLDAALARAEALADEMLARQAQMPAASADEPEYPSDTPVTSQPLPPPVVGGNAAPSAPSL